MEVTLPWVQIKIKPERMKKVYKIITIAVLSLVMHTNYAQQDAQYTQYMYNTISVNPAYAGSRGVMSILGLHRSQWVGLDGAPRTQTLSVHTPLGCLLYTSDAADD